MTLTLGFSPCPNDTFIFDALVNNKIDTEGLHFEVGLHDVQQLNQMAKAESLDITKISYGVLPKVLPKYIVLNSGGALGKGVGPLLISRLPDLPVSAPQSNNQEALQTIVNASLIAIPGEDTTAHFLFSQAFPNATRKIFIRFEEIESFVASGKGLGVIIHENRFTYAQKGLHKLIDLGSFWEATTGNPIPLGGIVMKRSLGPALIEKVNRLIQKSLAYAFAQYPTLPDFVRLHAQEMSETVMLQHIDLYVNKFSMDLGLQGKAAVETLLRSLAKTESEPVAIFMLGQ
jgi:1,4-dihydroxy-6-naphthoate synthase